MPRTDLDHSSPVPATSDRAALLDRIARTHIVTALGVSLFPLPVIDAVVVTGVQLDLIRKLAAVYGVPFDAGRSRAILTALLGGTLPILVGLPAHWLIKLVPLVGNAASLLTIPVLFGATTYAVHQVFVDHFEAGGTLADFDTAKAKQSFARYFAAGKTVAAALAKSETKAA